jgi:hypothetical protein
MRPTPSFVQIALAYVDGLAADAEELAEPSVRNALQIELEEPRLAPRERRVASGREAALVAVDAPEEAFPYRRQQERCRHERRVEALRDRRGLQAARAVAGEHEWSGRVLRAERFDVISGASIQHCAAQRRPGLEHAVELRRVPRIDRGARDRELSPGRAPRAHALAVVMEDDGSDVVVACTATSSEQLARGFVPDLGASYPQRRRTPLSPPDAADLRA